MIHECRSTYRGSIITTRSTEEIKAESGSRRFSASYSIENGSRGGSGEQTFVDLVFDSMANAGNHALAQARRMVDSETRLMSEVKVGAIPQIIAPKRTRLRHMKFMHQGYNITALSVEMATTGKPKQYQAAFTLEGHAGDSMPGMPAGHRVFESHAKALRWARLDAKRFVVLIGKESP